MILQTDKAAEAARWAAAEMLLERGVHTEQELDFWFRFVWGVSFPKTACCEHHHSPWEVIRSYFFEEHRKIAWRNARGGGKTYGVAAAISAKALLYPGIRIANFAASKSQADNLWAHVSSMLGPKAPAKLLNYIGQNVQQEEANLAARKSWQTGRVEQSLLKMVVGTMKGVNSLHCCDVVVDERALMDDAIYREAQGMRTPHEPFKGTLVVISSVKRHGDPMERIMRGEAKGFKVFDTCILDSIACRETNCDACKAAISVSADGQRASSFYDFCQGRLLGQNRPGHYSAEAAREKFVEFGLEGAEAQLLCLRPHGESTAFPQYRPERNLADWDARVRLQNNPQYFLMADFGRRDDTYFGKLFWDGDAIYVSDEMSGSGLTIADWIQRLKRAGWDRGCAGILCDEAGSQTTIVSNESAIDKLREAGWKVYTRKCVSEENDTDRVRELIQKGRVVLHPSRVPVLRESLSLATNKSLGVKGDNSIYLKVLRHNKYSHPAAALRYACMLLEPDDAAPAPDRWSL